MQANEANKKQFFRNYIFIFTVTRIPPQGFLLCYMYMPALFHTASRTKIEFYNPLIVRAGVSTWRLPWLSIEQIEKISIIEKITRWIGRYRRISLLSSRQMASKRAQAEWLVAYCSVWAMLFGKSYVETAHFYGKLKNSEHLATMCTYENANNYRYTTQVFC